MTTRSFVLRRLAWTIVVCWLVLSGTFALFVLVPDPNVPWVPPGPLAKEKAERLTRLYFEQMHYDEPLLQRYLHWMKAYATLQWGRSYVSGRAVTSIVADAGAITSAYLLPGLLLATALGMAQGLYGTLSRLNPVTRVGRGLMYTGLGLPAFWLGEMGFFALETWFHLGVRYDPETALLSVHNLSALVLPTVVVTLNVGAVFARYTQAETSEYTSRGFVKMIKASGGRSRDIARHTIRNAMPPLLSVFFTRLMTVILLTVYALELVFGLPGLGQVTLRAIENRDIAVILGMAFITVLVGLLGNLLQDIAYRVLDPRIESTNGGER